MAYMPSAFSMSAAAADDSQHEVVVDLMGFLVEVNNTAAAGQLGFGNILGSMFGGTNPQKLKPDFFATLAQTDTRETPVDLYWDGEKAPYPIYENVTGGRTSAEILADVQAGIERLSPSNKALMLSCAQMTFDPKASAGIMQPIAGARVLLHRLHQERQPVHVLPNWNAEGAQHLFDGNTLRTEKAYISGDIMTSGKAGTVKSGDLFVEFEKCTRPQLKAPIYIETDRRHVTRFEQLRDAGRLNEDAVAILHTGDFDATRRLLIEHGALKDE